MPDTAPGGDATPEMMAPTFLSPPGYPPALAKALPWIAAGVLGTAVCLVYVPALSAPLVFDDYHSILLNGSIKSLWPLMGNRGTAPLSPPDASPTAGRPLVNLTLALNYAISGTDLDSYRVFNILLHVLAALVLWGLVRRTLRLEYFGGKFGRAADPLALLVALVWALHPLQTEAIEYVTQRTELMVSLFYLATLYCSLRYFTASEPQRTRWCWLAAAASCLGMACKESMVTVPVVVLFFEWTFIAGSFREKLRKSWPLYAGLAASWWVMLALNYDTPRSESAGFGLGIPLLPYWCAQTKVLLMYLKLSVWPWPLVISYDVPPETFSAAWPFVLAAALLGLATLVLLWRKSALGFLGAWVLIILSPTLVVPILREVAAERRMYLPLAAIVAAAGGRGLPAAERRGTTAGTRRRTAEPLAFGRDLRHRAARRRGIGLRQCPAVAGLRDLARAVGRRRDASARQRGCAG